MSASADVLALASAEFDLSDIPLGSTITGPFVTFDDDPST
jgi:hypothetical protein